LFVSLWLSALFLGAQAAPGRAATFTATCSGTTGNVSSLISAINSANSAPGADTVQMGTGCTYALTAVNNYWYGPNGLPPIASDIAIEGDGSTITRLSSAPSFRLFFVGASPSIPSTAGYVSPGPGVLMLRDMTLSGGLVKGGAGREGGGGAGMGGAVFSQGTVNIDASTLTVNEAEGGPTAGMSTGTYGGGGMGESSGFSGGGFGGGPLGGPSGGEGGPNGGGGGGGAGFAEGENGLPAGSGISGPGPGGGPRTGLGGSGGSGEIGGDGSGGGGCPGAPSSTSTGGHGGRFGGGGEFVSEGGVEPGGAGGGVGGGGSAGECGGGGGFGGGGGSGYVGGDGGFGGGAGAGTGGVGAAGFGGGTASAGSNGGGGAGMGGAIFNMQGQLTIENSTLAGNTALGGEANPGDEGKGIGGAVFNLSGSFTSTDSTFAANAGASYASQIYNLVYDGHTERTAQTTLRGTIVAGGVGAVDVASAKTALITPPDLGSASADVSRFDLVRTMTAQEQGTITGSPLTADPLLGPLQANGGPTPSMALMSGSPAIDAGNSFGLATDQRGDPRPVDFPGVADAIGGDGADIGAFEVQQSCLLQALPFEACHLLTVSRAGSGAGKVSGSGISCPGNCSDSYGASTTIMLTATPAAGSRFAGWSGACSGTGTCTVAMSADRSVTARFAAESPRPSITALTQSASKWREGKKLAQISRKRKKPPIGTTFSFRLNEQATVSFTFEQRLPGQKIGHRCVARTKKNGHRKACKRTVTEGTLSFTGHRGTDKVVFQGRISHSKKLKPGRYRLSIIATSATGVHSAPVSLSFTIVS